MQFWMTNIYKYCQARFRKLLGIRAMESERTIVRSLVPELPRSHRAVLSLPVYENQENAYSQ